MLFSFDKKLKQLKIPKKENQQLEA